MHAPATMGIEFTAVNDHGIGLVNDLNFQTVMIENAADLFTVSGSGSGGVITVNMRNLITNG